MSDHSQVLNISRFTPSHTEVVVQPVSNNTNKRAPFVRVPEPEHNPVVWKLLVALLPVMEPIVTALVVMKGRVTELKRKGMS